MQGARGRRVVPVEQVYGVYAVGVEHPCGGVDVCLGPAWEGDRWSAGLGCAGDVGRWVCLLAGWHGGSWNGLVWIWWGVVW